jgi:hypothetical protein
MSEILYACTFASRSGLRITHVRAWDPGDALDLFVAELRSEGITEAGEVEVVPLHGGRGSSARVGPHVVGAAAE